MRLQFRRLGHSQLRVSACRRPCSPARELSPKQLASSVGAQTSKRIRLQNEKDSSALVGHAICPRRMRPATCLDQRARHPPRSGHHFSLVGAIASSHVAHRRTVHTLPATAGDPAARSPAFTALAVTLCTAQPPTAQHSPALALVPDTQAHTHTHSSAKQLQAPAQDSLRSVVGTSTELSERNALVCLHLCVVKLTTPFSPPVHLVQFVSLRENSLALASLRLPGVAVPAAPQSPTASTIASTSAPILGGARASSSRAPPTTIYEEELHYVRVHSTRRTDDATTIHPPFPDDDLSDFESARGASSDNLEQPAPHTERRRPFARRPPVHPAKPSASAPLLSDPDGRRVALQRDVASEEDDDDAATNITVATDRSASSRSSGRKRRRAKMAAKVVSKPIKKSYVGMVAGLASTVGLGQAMFLKATYESPPDARGPRSGVERPNMQTLSSSEGHVTRIVASATGNHMPAASVGASEATQNAVNAAVDAAVESVRAEIGSLDLSPIVVKHGNETVTTHKRILIIGDSLVSGVGGLSSFDDGPADGPALPRQVARYLSEMLNVDVQWNAMSLTGGDVRMLKRKIVPMLTREKERGAIGDISAVVLVTGVNDWKRISPIRTANKFREDLAEFIEKIREQLGEDVSIFLPAIPGVHHTPRFHEPLRSIVVFLNDYWDSQKVQLSRSMEGVYFVGQPPSHEWGANPLQFFSTLDRVHPSELGYQRWAERIAEHMVTAFEKLSNTAKATVSKASISASSTMAKATNTAAFAITSATQKATEAASNVVEQAVDAADVAKNEVPGPTAAVSVVAGGQKPPTP